MRRKDREVTDKQEIFNIMKKCDVCSLAVLDDTFPYIVPVNFGISLQNDKFTLYFHGAEAGTKYNLIKKNPHAAFEMNCSRKLITGEKACNYSMEYESVCGNGIIEILEREEKLGALTILMSQYSKNGEIYEFDEKAVAATTVYKLTVHEISGKRHIK